ncbi:MAG: hypothetical protein ACPHLK_04235 [Gammaproteobacteria bacterium]|jgi:hypothetical protein
MLKNTNSRIRYIFAIFLYSVLLSACSNSPKIISATESKVILKAKPKPGIFLEAYDLAQRKCTTDERVAYATYISDNTDSLDRVAFNCFDPNAEVLAEAEATTEEQAESDIEAVPEDPLDEIPEEIPAEETIQ